MPVPPAPDRHLKARAGLTLLLLFCDAGLVAIVGVAWNVQGKGWLSGGDVAALDVLGVNAAVGVAVLALTFAATVLAARGRGAGALAGLAWSLALLRLVAVLVAGFFVVIGLEPTERPAGAFVVVLALMDAGGALVATGAARKPTRG